MKTTLAITLKNRTILDNLLNTFSIDQLNNTPEGFKNNIFWNIAHVVATQQLLVYKLSNLPMQLPEIGINLFWHSRFHKEVGNRWLRNLIFDMFSD
jgi:hypothetical protein